MKWNHVLLTCGLALLLAACDRLPGSDLSQNGLIVAEQGCPELVEIDLETQVRVLVSSSNTKELWMNQMAEAFNAQENTTERGQQVVVQMWNTGSGLNIGCQPVAWSPSDETRIAPVNQEWRQRESFPLIADTCPSTVAIPIGIAMWQPMAEALGWPDEDISWDDIVDLATDARGWGAHGNAEWGNLIYGHGNPRFSTSGRLSVVTQIYAATDVDGVLRANEVQSQEASEAVGAVQASIGNYGRIDTDLLDRMAEHGPTYLHAITNYEGNVVRWNEEKFSQREAPWNKLVLIYPAEGTFWVDHPFCVLDNALYAEPGAIEGARLFRDFIMEREQQSELIETGIRPAIDDVVLDYDGSPFSLENGVIPENNINRIPPLAYPSSNTLDQVIAMWEENKKRVTMAVVFDRSQHMNNFLDDSRREAITFLDAFHPNDEILLVDFANNQRLFRPVDRLENTRQGITDRLNAIRAGDSSHLHEAIGDTSRRLMAMRSDDVNRNESRLYGLIIVTAGVNDDAQYSIEDLYEALPDGSESDQVRVHVIAIGERAANNEVLQRVAEQTNGGFYPTTSQDVGEVFFQISSEF